MPWEYKTIESRSENENEDILNGEGRDGWELVSVVFREGTDNELAYWESWMFFFKRRKG